MTDRTHTEEGSQSPDTPPLPCSGPTPPSPRVLAVQALGEAQAETGLEAPGDNPAGDPRLPRDLAVAVIDPPTLAHQIAHWTQMRALLTAYIRQHMTEGIDYYTLLVGGKPTKPSLSKAGSEKFLSLFNLQARFRKDDETWDMLGRPAGVICYVCALYTKQGDCVGEGRGAREVTKDQDINKAIKMAQKSAQIDAILRTGSLSDSFTQDLEDQGVQEQGTMRPQKRRIVALLKHLGIATADKAGYEEAVRQYTGLALVPEHFPEIIHRLERCIQEQGPDEGSPAPRARARAWVP
jgi:hypothetical protein